MIFINKSKSKMCMKIEPRIIISKNLSTNDLQRKTRNKHACIKSAKILFQGTYT
jgi:hypothetical protein